MLGGDADFSDTSLVFSFNSSMGDFPFNGFRFFLVNPTVQTLDVRLVSTNIAGLDQSYVSFRSNAIAINTVHTMVGSLELFIRTDLLIAVEKSTWSGVKSLYRP